MQVEHIVNSNKLFRTAKMLQDIFGTAILIQFGIGGWILCMAAYKIVSVSALIWAGFIIICGLCKSCQKAL